jgi:hypothetical protein
MGADRVPLVICASDAPYSRKELLGGLGRPVLEFDLRRQGWLKGQEEEKRKEEAQRWRQELGECFREGRLLVLNLDDNEEVELGSQPDLCEFFGAEGLPCEILQPRALLRPEVFGPVTGGARPSGQLGIMVWSRFRVEAGLEYKRLIEEVVRRFAQVLPIPRMDIVLAVAP